MEEVEGRLYRPVSRDQSDELAAFDGAGGVAVDVELLDPESPEPEPELDFDESLDDPESLVAVLDEDDFDFPPRLSVL